MGCHNVSHAPVWVRIHKPGYEAKWSTWMVGSRDPYEFRGRWYSFVGKTHLICIIAQVHRIVLCNYWHSVSEEGHEWQLKWETCDQEHRTSHYLNYCSDIVNWTLRNILQWNLNRNSYIFIKKMHGNISSGKWRPFCLGHNVLKDTIWMAFFHQNGFHCLKQCTGLHNPVFFWEHWVT